MQSSTSKTVLASVAALAAIGLSPVVAGAEESARAFSTAEVRQQFVQCGYEMANPTSASGTRAFAVRDPLSGASENGRILMVLVYGDPAEATAVHLKAHQSAEAKSTFRRVDTDHGPQLLVGYGGSVWRNNVAMLQTTPRELNSIWYTDMQTEEATLQRPEALDLGFVSTPAPYAVDADFVDCLERVQPAPVMAVGPSFRDTTPTLALPTRLGSPF